MDDKLMKPFNSPISATPCTLSVLGATPTYLRLLEQWNELDTRRADNDNCPRIRLASCPDVILK